MTLCKYRPQRTYAEQLIVDKWELDALSKQLAKRALEMADNGESDALLFIGACNAFEALMRLAEDGKCEYWFDFMREFEHASGLEGGDDGSERPDTGA